MQKAKIKLYVRKKLFPLFECEITDDIEASLKELQDKLNDRSADTIKFGQICFKREDFRYFEIRYTRK